MVKTDRHHPLSEIAATLVVRDRDLRQRELMLLVLSNYNMGAAVNAPLDKRLQSLETPLSEYAGALSHALYSGEARSRQLERKLDAMKGELRLMTRLDQMSSTEFNLKDWLENKGSWKIEP